MTSVVGAALWAVVPYVPAAPFRVYAGVASPPLVVEDAARIIDGARAGGDAELTFLTTGKARPILVVAEVRRGSIDELLALRLLRLSKLSAEERARVEAGEDPALLPLPPTRFAGLGQENAAMIASLVRVDRSAVAPRTLGRLDDAGIADVHARITRLHRFNVRELVMERLQVLAEAQRRR